MKKERNTIKIVTTILAVLLILSLVALAGIFLYNKFFRTQPTTVLVPNNLITPEPEEGGVGAESTQENQDGNQDVVEATALSLYASHPKDNTPFTIRNMFPGDSITQNFCVQVSYHGRVNVHYGVELRPGSEKLAEALWIQIKLLSDDTILYDGTMKNMPENCAYLLESKKSTKTNLYYEIKAYLPTDTGNEYQNQTLIADFKWWVEETKYLEPGPKTGDITTVQVLGGLTLVSGVTCAVLVLQRKRKEEQTYDTE